MKSRLKKLEKFLLVLLMMFTCIGVNTTTTHASNGVYNSTISEAMMPEISETTPIKNNLVLEGGFSSELPQFDKCNVLIDGTKQSATAKEIAGKYIYSPWWNNYLVARSGSSKYHFYYNITPETTIWKMWNHVGRYKGELINVKVTYSDFVPYNAEEQAKVAELAEGTALNGNKWYTPVFGVPNQDTKVLKGENEYEQNIHSYKVTYELIYAEGPKQGQKVAIQDSNIVVGGFNILEWIAPSTGIEKISRLRDTIMVGTIPANLPENGLGIRDYFSRGLRTTTNWVAAKDNWAEYPNYKSSTNPSGTEYGGYLRLHIANGATSFSMVKGKALTYNNTMETSIKTLNFDTGQFYVVYIDDSTGKYLDEYYYSAANTTNVTDTYKTTPTINTLKSKGYALISDQYAAEGKNTTGHRFVKDENKRYEVHVAKDIFINKVSANGTHIPGARLLVWTDNDNSEIDKPVADKQYNCVGEDKGCVWEIESSDYPNGVRYQDFINAGKSLVVGKTYYVREIRKPGNTDNDKAGYVQSEQRAFVFGTDTEVLMRNFRINTLKKDDQGNNLGGAEFALYEGEWKSGTPTGTPIDTWSSSDGSSHILRNLVEGKTYTIIETKTPSGYKTMSPYTFEAVHDANEVKYGLHLVNTPLDKYTITTSIDHGKISPTLLVGRKGTIYKNMECSS